MSIIAWHTPPSPSEILRHRHAKHLVICLSNKNLPDWSDHPIFQAALSCVQFGGANILENVLPNQTLYLLPEHAARKLSDYFGNQTIHWQTQAITQDDVLPTKMWFRQPENIAPPQTTTHHYGVLVVGAGIAGAATARELARRGVKVAVLDAADAPARAASGNHQGLLYAKISPHNTPQTELLLSAYGYARRLLEQTLPDSNVWGATGVLHINHHDTESQRNAILATQTWHAHLYRAVSAAQASELAGVPLEQSGLFWQQGAWVHPAAWVKALLAHEHIDFYPNSKVTAAHFNGTHWQVQTTHSHFSGSHIVFCTGANHKNTPIIQAFPFQYIRGQTSLAHSVSGSLKTALSGASYIAPAWDGVSCFGATFTPNDENDDWREMDDLHNQNELAKLNHHVYGSLAFSGSLKGHAAVRCDAHDHLPVVGALGKPNEMRKVYAKLAWDKNYRLNEPCPFHPNAWANTAHGSRGLVTAPICAAQIAAWICGTPNVLSMRLQQALHPNRLIIKQIVFKK